MIHLLERLWPALAAVAALGVLFAAIGGPGHRLPSAGWPARALASALLTGAAIASALRVVPGAVGLWLDIGLLLGIAYLAGIAGGSGLRRLVVGRVSDERDDASAASASPATSPPGADPTPAA